MHSAVLEPPHFVALRERLLRAGIAPRRVRRYLAELDDHLVELTRCEEDAGYDKPDAAIRARAALGDDTLLAEAMLSQPKLRSFTARAPWLIFGVLPPFAVILGFILPLLFLIIIGKLTGVMGKPSLPTPAWYGALLEGVAILLDLTVAPLAAAFLVGIAWRQRLKPLWPILAIAILSLLLIQMQAHFSSPHGPNSIQITMGSIFRLGFRNGPPPHPMFWPYQAPLMAAQLLLTLAPAAWLIHARRRAAQL